MDNKEVGQIKNLSFNVMRKNPHGRTKLDVDTRLGDLAGWEYELDTLSPRCFNPAAVYDSGNLNESSKVQMGSLFQAVFKAHMNNKPLSTIKNEGTAHKGV